MGREGERKWKRAEKWGTEEERRGGTRSERRSRRCNVRGKSRRRGERRGKKGDVRDENKGCRRRRRRRGKSKKKKKRRSLFCRKKSQAIWWDGITLAMHIQPSCSCLVNTQHAARWFICMCVCECVWDHCEHSKRALGLENFLPHIQSRLSVLSVY